MGDKQVDRHPNIDPYTEKQEQCEAVGAPNLKTMRPRKVRSNAVIKTFVPHPSSEKKNCSVRIVFMIAS